MSAVGRAPRVELGVVASSSTLIHPASWFVSNAGGTADDVLLGGRLRAFRGSDFRQRSGGATTVALGGWSFQWSSGCQSEQTDGPLNICS